MEIFIELATTDFDSILQHITPKSRLHTKLAASQILFRGRRRNVIYCSESDAILLLEIARTHAPDAIKGIRKGLSDAGRAIKWP